MVSQKPLNENRHRSSNKGGRKYNDTRKDDNADNDADDGTINNKCYVI